MSAAEMVTIGQRQCVHGCRHAELGLACTAAGEVVPTASQVALCSPDAACTDAIMHRTVDRDWHTCRGTTPEEWFAERTTVGVR